MTTPELEAEREFIATRLCTSHQAASPTRMPCAACVQEVDSLVAAARAEDTGLRDRMATAFSGGQFEENAAAAAGEGEWSWFRWLALSTIEVER